MGKEQFLKSSMWEVYSDLRQRRSFSSLRLKNEDGLCSELPSDSRGSDSQESVTCVNDDRHFDAVASLWDTAVGTAIGHDAVIESLPRVGKRWHVQHVR